MAHFAELDQGNRVQQVLVVDNEKLLDDKGKEQEQLGVKFLQGLFGSNTCWAQTSYNSKFRHKYAGIGDIYDAQRDVFYPPQPYASWLLNELTLTWEPPSPMPNDGALYHWDESVAGWVAAP